MKGIILAGGLGSRLYPLTLSVSKHLLPVFDKPLIYYPLSVLMLAKIREILIVCNEEHLDQYECLLSNSENLGLKIKFAVQEQPKGICDALLVGQEFIKNDDFTLILGDNIFYGPGMTYLMQKSIKNNKQGATIFTYHVYDQSQFGVVKYHNDGKIKEIVEKPSGKKAGLAVTGLYVFKNDAMNFCKDIPESARGECEITSLLNVYAKKNLLNEQELGRGFVWFDGGSFDTLFEASNFVKSVQNRHGHKVACLEEISLKNGWLDRSCKETSIFYKANNEYTNYVNQL